MLHGVPPGLRLLYIESFFTGVSEKGQSYPLFLLISYCLCHWSQVLKMARHIPIVTTLSLNDIACRSRSSSHVVPRPSPLNHSHRESYNVSLAWSPLRNVTQ